MKSNYTAVTLALLLGAGIAQGAELIIDNGSPQFTTLGEWPLSTAVAGYEGKHYQTHINNAPPPGSLLVDNQDPGFSVTGDWPVSTAVGGYLGSNYRTHASNGPKPGSLVVDNPSGIPVGDWPNSTSVGGAQGGSYQTHTAGTGQAFFTWPLAGNGQYRVYARWTAYGNRATNAQYQVRHAAGTSTVTVDQRQNGGQWVLLGTYDLDASSQVALTDQANGYVIADAVMAEPVAATANTATWQLPVTETKAYQVYARWTAHPNRATNAKYRVTHSNGSIDIPVSQQQQSGQWVLLGNFTLSPGKASVSLTDEADGYVIADAVMANPQDGLGANAAIWSPSLSQGGRYDIYAKWTAYPNRATNAQYRIQHQSGEAVVEVNQQQNGGQWNLLGRYDLVPGQARISLTDQANGYVIADAVRLVEAAPDGGVVYYIDADHLNTPRVVTDGQGKVVWRSLPLAEPFGNTPPEDDPDGDGKRFAMNLRFPGQYADKETNTNYNYFRDYDPATGRYIQSDPIGLQGGINTYGYVKGNPLSYVDPSGKDPLVVIGALIGGVAGAVQAANSGGGWTADNALNIFAGAGTGALVGGLAGLVPTEAGPLAALVTGALAGGGGNLAGQGTSWAIDRYNNPQSCTPFKPDWQAAGTQALLGGSAALLGFGAGFGSALSIVESGGTSAGALNYGALMNAWTAGAAQVVGNNFIPTTSGGFLRP